MASYRFEQTSQKQVTPRRRQNTRPLLRSSNHPEPFVFRWLVAIGQPSSSSTVSWLSLNSMSMKSARAANPSVVISPAMVIRVRRVVGAKDVPEECRHAAGQDQRDEERHPRVRHREVVHGLQRPQVVLRGLAVVDDSVGEVLAGYGDQALEGERDDVGSGKHAASEQHADRTAVADMVVGVWVDGV